VQEILAEIDLIVPHSVTGQGFERLFPPYSRFLVGGGNGATGARLYSEKTDLSDGKFLQSVFFKSIASRKNDIGTEAVDGLWFLQPPVEVIKGSLADQQKRKGI
jgi:hypothetical protein